MCIQMHAHSMRSESCEAKSLVISAHTHKANGGQAWARRHAMERVAHRRSKPGGRRGGQSHRSCRPAAAQSVVTSVSHPRGGAK